MSSIEKRKKSRVKRPPQEVVERLEEQTGFLVSSCRTFDEGNYAEAKRLSVHLRILLHTGRAPVVSLLSQLGAAFKWNRFWSAMIPHNPHGLLSYHGLIVTKMGGSDIKYLPSLDGLADQFLQQHHFVKWWQRTIVFKDRLGQTFSRKDLVLALANTDGGAHVDSDLDESYFRLSRENSLGWTFNAGSKRWFQDPVPPSIRQIAHELLRTLEAQGFETNYAPLNAGLQC